MSVVGFIIGITAVLVLFLTILPVLQWINWINIPLAVIGLAFSVMGTICSSHKGFGIPGIVVCCAVIILAALRLKAFGGYY